MRIRVRIFRPLIPPLIIRLLLFLAAALLVPRGQGNWRARYARLHDQGRDGPPARVGVACSNEDHYALTISAVSAPYGVDSYDPLLLLANAQTWTRMPHHRCRVAIIAISMWSHSYHRLGNGFCAYIHGLIEGVEGSIAEMRHAHERRCPASPLSLSSPTSLSPPPFSANCRPAIVLKICDLRGGPSEVEGPNHLRC